MSLNEYIQSGSKLLRCGYTTGSCATLATKACAIMLHTQEKISSVSIITPKGIEVVADVLEIILNEDSVTCAIRKDAGDDIDVTDGMLIYSTVSYTTDDIFIEGGVGIGVVTKAGLNQPIGKHAINSTPRKMILEQLTKLKQKYKYNGGYKTTIFAPNGEKIAERTFNSNLGIIGGISIIGTTGIVEPQSLQALLDSIKVEINMHNSNKVKRLILTFGNYGQDFIGTNVFKVLSQYEQVKISNFVGDTLDSIFHTDIQEVILVGHIGKVVKLAGGIMNTHSKIADCRTEIFGVHTALNGGSQESVQQIMESATTDACIDILDSIGLKELVINDIISTASNHINRRIANKFKVGIITFSNIHGLLNISKTAQELLVHW